MALHLVTGYAGYEHITSADQGSFNASFFGEGQYVLEAGNGMQASILDNNTIRILDGSVLMKGRHFMINRNTYEDVTIENGASGMKRCDLIVLEYHKSNSSGIETPALVVIKGEATTETPRVPEYTDGDILGGATFNQMPLYKVNIDGVVLKSVESVFETMKPFAVLAEIYKAEFIKACENHLDSLMVLETMEEIDANTQEKRLAGALALKELLVEFDEMNAKLEDYLPKSGGNVTNLTVAGSKVITAADVSVVNGVVNLNLS